MKYKKKNKPKSYRVDNCRAMLRVFVRERGPDTAVACFKYSAQGEHGTATVMMAVAHALILEDRSKGIRHDQP